MIQPNQPLPDIGPDNLDLDWEPDEDDDEDDDLDDDDDWENY